MEKIWSKETLSVLDVIADRPSEEEIEFTVKALYKMQQDFFEELSLPAIITGYAWIAEELYNQVTDITMAVHEQAMNDLGV